MGPKGRFTEPTSFKVHLAWKMIVRLVHSCTLNTFLLIIFPHSKINFDNVLLHISCGSYILFYSCSFLTGFAVMQSSFFKFPYLFCNHASFKHGSSNKTYNWNIIHTGFVVSKTNIVFRVLSKLLSPWTLDSIYIIECSKLLFYCYFLIN